MTILITGANRGIGHALFKAYEARGDAVIGTTRAEKQEGENWIGLDVTDPTSIDSLQKHWAERPLDLLICNAGVYLDKGNSIESGYAAQDWSDTFAVNVTGVFLTIQALLPALGKAAPSRIAILSSMMASSELASGRSYIYRASKAAALNLGRNLAADLKGHGISVGVYHPGWVRTDMGGAAADLDADEAVRGLLERFDALGPSNTGCFETWDGRPHPY